MVGKYDNAVLKEWADIDCLLFSIPTLSEIINSE